MLSTPTEDIHQIYIVILGPMTREKPNKGKLREILLIQEIWNFNNSEITFLEMQRQTYLHPWL